MKRAITASYESKFWDLHDRDYNTGTTLEEIIEDEGLTDEFFPDDGEPIVDEEDYKRILTLYETNGRSSLQIDEVIDEVTSFLRSMDGITSARYEDEIEAIRFNISGSGTYQLVLQQVRW